MPYQPNIPQATDQLSQSQSDLLGNFQALQTLIDVNHVDFASGDQGKHQFVELVANGSAPAFTSTETGFYNKIPASPYPLTTKNETFIHANLNSGAADIPMSASILSTSTPAALTAGWTYLPSGLIMKWSSNVTITGYATVTFPTGGAIPAFTTCLMVIPQVAEQNSNTDTNHAIRLCAVNPTNFVVYGSPRTSTGSATVIITYIAIGY